MTNCKGLQLYVNMMYLYLYYENIESSKRLLYWDDNYFIIIYSYCAENENVMLVIVVVVLPKTVVLVFVTVSGPADFAATIHVVVNNIKVLP